MRSSSPAAAASVRGGSLDSNVGETRNALAGATDQRPPELLVGGVVDAWPADRRNPSSTPWSSEAARWRRASSGGSGERCRGRSGPDPRGARRSGSGVSGPARRGRARVSSSLFRSRGAAQFERDIERPAKTARRDPGRDPGGTRGDRGAVPAPVPRTFPAAVTILVPSSARRTSMAMRRARIAQAHADWLGLVETPARLPERACLAARLSHGIDPAPDDVRARRAASSNARISQAERTDWIRGYLREALGLAPVLLEGQAVPETATHFVAEHGEVLRPEFVVIDPTDRDGDGVSRLLVMTWPDGTRRDLPLPGRWATTPLERAAALARATGVRSCHGDGW